MQRVLDQANAAQNKYGNPESESYITNYNVIASINGAGYNMQTGEPGGLLVMNGKEYHPIDANGFFGILKDGTPVIGTTAEYNTIYKGQVRDAIAGFGSTLVKDGEVCITATSNYYTDRASRTAIGITRTGKVVFMVLDGRQEPWSCGGSMIEIAQIMREAGCVHAINLDGGGSTTYVAKPEGEDALQVISRPSDGAARSVSTSLFMVSTAASSTAFDHAILETTTNYMTAGTSLQVTAEGVSATGNPAEIPEGTTWTVSDETLASITEDGLFTAKSHGSVDVNLMLGDTSIGSKTLHIVYPDNVYFTKDKVDVVYGETVDLPVKAIYEGKPVTIQPSDLVFKVENPEAGNVNGFSFTAGEAGKVKMTKVTVTLANNKAVSASINVALYNQGEVSFAFDQATGGDRQMAWDRKVSNSTTADAVTYEIVNPDEDMVTSYIFAIDMTQIPIPEKLEDLTYMLPGADMEGASAWTFLLQLAQRVSVLTEVKPVLHFDPNFEVDYSGLTLVNDYFILQGTELNEETNTLTLTLKWKKQTEPIDPAEANPLCILSGIKLIPKEDAAWNEKDMLKAVHTGEVGYNIFLRASSLYTFAQKPENQQVFGLKPFVNPDDRSEAGASFGDIYKEFEDTYTLLRKLKNGWQTEDGGYAYYVDGVRYTGVRKIDGYYYDFGEDGINIGQTKYTGLFWDTTVSAYRYAQIGVLASGWKSIDGEWYHFWKDNYCASVGRHNWTDVYYTFDKTGRLISGEWKEEEAGTKYFYGPTNYKKTWAVIDGNEYYFDENGYRAENYQIVKDSWTNPNQMYQFTADGILVEKLTITGLLDTGDTLYYLVDGIVQYGLFFVEGYYYYFNSTFAAVTGTYYVSQTNGLVPQGNYLFDENHRMVVSGKNGLVQEYDGLYYYVNNTPVFAGLIKIDGYYYYINSDCKAVSGMYYVSKTNDIMMQGEYEFDENCRMILNGLVKENGGLYYYENGKLKDAGLIMIDGSYYYVNNRGLAVTGSYYVEKTNGIMAQGRYEFADDSTMILEGLVKENDGLFYYENNKRTYAGVIKIGEDHYYIESDGKAVVGTTHYVEKTNELVPEGEYEFTDEGKMVYVPETEPEPEEPVSQHKYGQNAQIKLIEPWGLKANARIYTAENGTIDYSKLYDYGVYFIRGSELDKAGLTQATITPEDILNDADAVKMTKNNGVEIAYNGYLSAVYDRGIYTYELADSVFVMYYYITEEGTDPVYIPIRERNLKQLVGSRKGDTSGSFTDKERAVYSYMDQLETDITDYRSDFTITGTPEPQKAPMLSQYPLGAAAANNPYTYGNNAQIKLIEPWGMKVNVKLSESGKVIDYSTVEECGIVALADNVNTYATAEEVLANENAYVFSTKNGDAEITSNGYISAVYSKDIFTYQLDTNVYVFGYVKNADGFHYGPVRVRNLYDLMSTRRDDTSGSFTAKEQKVYASMVELYSAVTIYREEFLK